MKRTTSFAAALALLAVAANADTLQPGQQAPAFHIKTMSGKTLRLTDLRGKAVLLDFWGVGCPPCKIQMPVLQAWHKQYADVAWSSSVSRRWGPNQTSFARR
jgi:thiol-disulfide isomerase/thioredoxin